MKFGDTPLDQAAGAILAHSLRVGPRVLKKGHALTAADVAMLKAEGHSTVTTARLEQDDIGENAAAQRIARAVAGDHVTVAEPFTGRANLHAKEAGLCVVDRALVDRLNATDEAVTLATLEPMSVVEAKQMVATVKIIPFAVPEARLAACEAALKSASHAVAVAPLRGRRVALIQTQLPGMKLSILDKTVEVTRDRLTALGSELMGERRVAHDEAELAPAIKDTLAQGAELVLVASASAILDRRDVIPAAIEQAGGQIIHFGMPVDPGNLMLVGRVGGTDVLGLPGCARSPKVNGFDWVLRRILADLPVDRAAIAGMGVGGLLSDIPSRPAPRAKSPAALNPGKPRIAAIVLAAGRSSRMGTVNKLLIGLDGRPMVRHAVDAALEAGLAPVVVVTGHQGDQVEGALAGLPVQFERNPDFAEGLSTSLKTGLAKLPAETDAALVCLGDMPRINAADIGRILAAFDPREGRAIVVPTRHGKRGNPVLWDRQFFSAMRQVGGDTGAKHLIGDNPELIAEVEMKDDGVLTDIDTPQALAKLGQNMKIEV